MAGSTSDPLLGPMIVLVRVANAKNLFSTFSKLNKHEVWNMRRCKNYGSFRVEEVQALRYLDCNSQCQGL